MVEKFCGVKHFSFALEWWLRDSINIDEALDCVDKHNHSGHEFGSIIRAVNLWWGERTGKINNLGYVIGLRNLEAGIAWRLDYDENKTAHINQLTRLAGQKRWENLVHPIQFPGDPEIFVKWFWRRFTERNAHKIPAHILEKVKKLNPSHKVLHWL
jgi:hypothetical protein